jgi:hypothetical protein
MGKHVKWALLPALVLFVATGCTGSHYYGEEFSLYYDKPAEESRSERVDRKEIIHWAAHPKDRKRIGFLHTYDTKVEGSRTLRESHRIYDPLGVKAVGFVTAEGVFHRFDAQGRLGERVGEYPITTTGLKAFFRIPIAEHLSLEEIDPYK